MVLKQYDVDGSTFQFEEGEQPKHATETTQPAAAGDVFKTVDEAFQKAEAERVVTIVPAEGEVAKGEAADSDAEGAEGAEVPKVGSEATVDVVDVKPITEVQAPPVVEEKAKAPANKARAARNKAVTTTEGAEPAATPEAPAVDVVADEKPADK